MPCACLAATSPWAGPFPARPFAPPPRARAVGTRAHPDTCELRRPRTMGAMPSPASNRSARHAALIARALAHVETHLDAPLTAAVLADKAAMSRHHFHRMFQAHVGCSVSNYLEWRRLQRACALLTSGMEPVLEVALAVGYLSLIHI